MKVFNIELDMKNKNISTILTVCLCVLLSIIVTHFQRKALDNTVAKSTEYLNLSEPLHEGQRLILGMIPNITMQKVEWIEQYISDDYFYQYSFKANVQRKNNLVILKNIEILEEKKIDYPKNNIEFVTTVFNYSSKVETVNTTFYYLTTIFFEEDENIEEIIAGDTYSFMYETSISSFLNKYDLPCITIKPVRENAKTNVKIKTNKRNYEINLIVAPQKDYMHSVIWDTAYKKLITDIKDKHEE